MCHCHPHSSSGNSCGVDSKSCLCFCHSHCGCASQGNSGHLSAHSSQEGQCDYVSKFLDLADQAWMEVLKEKIKEHIRANPKNMDDLAKNISEANNERWHMKMENKHNVQAYEEKIRSFFSCSCQGQKK